MLLNLMFVLVLILLHVEPSVHLVEVFEMMRQQLTFVIQRITVLGFVIS